MVGLQRGWIAPILYAANDPHSDLPLTTEQCLWIASVGFVSRGLSPLFTSFLMDRIGRTPIIVFNALVYFSMWIAVYWSRDILVHYIICLMAGLSDGLVNTVAGIYVCENCSPQFRGTFFTIAIIFLYAGHLTVFVLATYSSYSFIAITYTVFGFVTLLSTLLTVEPTQYSLMRGNKTRAVKSFRRLRDLTDPSSVREFDAMKKNIEEEKSRTFSLALYRSPEVLKSLRPLLVMMFLSSECGYPAMTAFVTKLFSNSDDLSASQLSMVYGALQLICVGATSTIMDKFDRRTLMLVCCSCITIIHAAAATLCWFQSALGVTYFNIILFVFVTIFSCLYAMFMYPLIGILRGELMPQSVKITGAGLCIFMQSFGSFVNTRAFLPVVEAFGMEINFVIFSSSALIMVVYTYFDLPETRGKTLVQIQNELKGIDGRLESSRL